VGFFILLPAPVFHSIIVVSLTCTTYQCGSFFAVTVAWPEIFDYPSASPQYLLSSK